MHRNYYFIFWVIVATAFASGQDAKKAMEAELAGGIGLLNERYWSPTLGIWFDKPGDDLRAHFEGRHNPPWWPSANAVETLIDAASATGNTEWMRQVENLYSLNRDFKNKAPRLIAELQRRGLWTARDEERQRRSAAGSEADTRGYYVDFVNEYLDDSGWWGIAWLKMYDRTKDERFLKTARVIQLHMAKNWKPEKGGGVIWCEDEDKQVANAITNQLFAILSARLFSRTREPEFLE
ncbi:MAG: hypothetical protein RL088_2484 [Verrucomicrobiota bacterium]|jgi:hypothetical protein